MARIALATVCVTALVAFAAAEVSVIGPKDLYNPASSTSISLISPNEKGQQTMVEGAEELEALGPAVRLGVLQLLLLRSRLPYT